MKQLYPEILIATVNIDIFTISTSDMQTIRTNSPIPLDRLWWVVKYGPSKVHSHIQASDEKHIYCVARKGERDNIKSEL